MRKKNRNTPPEYKIIVVDDENGVIDSLSVVFKRSGYHISGTIDPLDAIEKIRNEHFDILILDYLMAPLHGDRVVELIREFNQDLYILLLTGYKDLAPPLKTIKTLDIQGYCEKSDRFDQLMLMVESGIKSVSQMRTIKLLKDDLNKILKSAPNIYKLQPLDLVAEAILSIVGKLFGNCNAFLMIDAFDQNFPPIFRGIGGYKTNTGNAIEKLSPVIFEQIGAVRTARRNIAFGGSLILPLINEIKGIVGVIYIEAQAVAEKKEILEIFSVQALSAFNNALLHEMLQTKKVELDSTYELLKQRYIEMVDVLRVVVDAKDIYTRGHSERVSHYATIIGKKLGLGADELETLRIGSLFHDIGKLGIADSILSKTGSLTQAEYKEIKKHPEKGYHILSAVSMFKEIVPIVKFHHERIDGKGYPEGLRQDEIPLLAKITSVADSFDAMMSDRTYRPRMSVNDAILELMAGIDTQFDADIVRVFVDLATAYEIPWQLEWSDRLYPV